MSTEKTKKISLFGCLTLGIGCIIGSGIFGSLPEAVLGIGPGVIGALILATIYTIIKVIPGTFSDAALVSDARTFMHFTKAIHPVMGMVQAVNMIFITSMLALYGVLFGEYFIVLFPGCPVSENVVGVIFVCLFSVIALFGYNVSSTVQNIFVALLFSGLILYSFVGISHLDTSIISFKEVFGVNAGLSGIVAYVAVLSSSLSGGGIIAEIGNNLENPKRNIPLCLVLCPTIVCGIYILMALATISAPIDNFTSLSQVAELYMSPGLFTYFVICGPVIAIVTSFIPYLLSMIAGFEYLGHQHVLPEIIGKHNKYGIAYCSLILSLVITVVIIITGQTFGVIMVIFSFANMIESFPIGILVFTIPKKFPNIAKNTPLLFPMPVIKITGVLMVILSLYLAIELLMTMDAVSWFACALVYGGGCIYMIWRNWYLKKRDGISLMEYLKKPYEPWEQLEKSYQK